MNKTLKMSKKKNQEGIKKEFLKTGIEITMELVSMGMTETEIMDFWKECVATATQNKMHSQSLSNN